MSVDARQLRNHLVDPRQLVAMLGLEQGSKRQGNGVMVRCPVHDDNTPSCSVRVAADGTIAFRCFACDATGDALDLVAAVNRLDAKNDFPRVVELAAHLAGFSDGLVPPAAPPRTPTPKRAQRPHLGEFFSCCGDVADDVALVGALKSRAIAADVVTDRKLAHALLASPPKWARRDGRSWLESGHRLVVPMYSATGALESVHARRLSRDGDDPKGLSPAGCSLTGLVFADPLARVLLTTGVAPQWWTERSIVIAEGVPDFLTWATHFGDQENSPAVIGVISGSWSQSIADRIPEGTQVFVRTHADTAGNKYARQIISTLRARCDVWARREVETP